MIPLYMLAIKACIEYHQHSTQMISAILGIKFKIFQDTKS